MSTTHCPTCHSPIDTHSAEHEPLSLEYLLDRSRSNDIPNSPTEKLAFEDEIDRLNSSVQKYDELIARLQEKRNRSAEARDLRKSLLLAPIRRLPFEVLVDIFELVVGGEPIEFYFNVSRSRRRGSIFPLTRVCSLWRRVLERASFWSSVQVVIDGSSDLSIRTHLEECLLRTGHATPIKLDLCISNSSSSPAPNLKDVLDTLINYSARWKYLKLWSDNAFYVEYILQFKDPSFQVHTRFPLLEVLEFDSDQFTREDSCEIFGSLPIHFPQLQELKIDFLSAEEGIDLRNLTALTMRFGFTGRSLATNLQNSLHLQKLVVGKIQTGENTTSSPFLYHTSLSTLEITMLEDCSANSFQSVCVPNLTDVTLIGHIVLEEQTRELFNEFKRMLVSSRCGLQKVRLDSIPKTAVSAFFQDVRLGPDPDLNVDGETYILPEVSSNSTQ